MGCRYEAYYWFDQPALGAVYKLVAIENSDGEYSDRIKLSNNAEKVTTPGKKNVYRIINKKTGKAEGLYYFTWKIQLKKSH